jgi:hypothetical protein
VSLGEECEREDPACCIIDSLDGLGEVLKALQELVEGQAGVAP